MAAGNIYKQYGRRSSRNMSSSGSKLLETRWAAVIFRRYGCAGWHACCIQQNHEICGNEPVWSIEATDQSRLTLFLNIIYALWSYCVYVQAGLSLCWSHIPHCYWSALFAMVPFWYGIKSLQPFPYHVLWQTVKTWISSGSSLFAF